IAAKYGITRQEQDAYALESQRRAAAAIAAGWFTAEIIPVSLDDGTAGNVIAVDEGPRPDSTMEGLARLRPAFQAGGTVTAGNASLISDGAAAAVLASDEAVRRLGLAPLARITGWTAVGNAPRWLFDAPVRAVRRLLDLTESTLDDYDAFELNEAYAAQCIANGRELGWDTERVNQRGGAIALGHPIGASGARILVTLLYTLIQTGGRRGMAVLCHGGGGAMAAAIERV
ncbi:MAG: thiolase family protein, partial [Chloroflexi bacterium]|nr:thiolase family protein [Chloroflexota bacterium]